MTTAVSERSKLRFQDLLIEAFTAVTQRPIRTLLTALGTILGVGAFVTTTGLADTARAQVSSRFDALKATEVRIQDAAPDGTNPFPDDVDRRLEALNGVNHAGLYFTVPDSYNLQPRATATRLVGNAQPIPIPVIAATPGGVEAARPVLQTGRLYDQFHQSRGERVALVGRVAADLLGLSRIDNQPAVFIGDQAYTVLGIIEDVKRNPDLLLSIVVPTSSIDARLANGADIQVLIDTAAGAASLAGRQAPLALRPDAPERLQALVPPDPKTLRNQVQGDITGLFYALACLALLIGTIAITNATLLNVIERRPEIGLRRALGSKRSHIAGQVTLEAALIGVLAAVTGAAIAILVVAGYSSVKGWTPTMSPASIALALPIGLATGALAGLAPAVRAARTAPASALRG